MKNALIVAFVASLSALVLAQDATKTDPTHYKVVLENASVRVLRISYAAEDRTIDRGIEILNRLARG